MLLNNLGFLVFSKYINIDIAQTDITHNKQDRSYLVEALSTNPEFLKNKVKISFPFYVFLLEIFIISWKWILIYFLN